MEIADLDLNLLVVFDAILQNRSVTAAAGKIGLSQSTISYELGKLRRLFDDPLFVRMPKGMQPTPRALRMADPIRRALDIVNGEVLKEFNFDPLKSTRTFTLCMSDVGEVHLLPKILHMLAGEAPGVSIKIVAIDRQNAERAMADGELDLLVGFFPDLKKSGIYQQSLFQHTYACLVRKKHPRIDSKITLKQFLAESHVVVRPEGRSYEVVERFLEKRGLSRRIVLVTPHFTSVPFIIAASDLITILPISLAHAFTRFSELKTISLPFDMPVYSIKQHWHERFHNDEESMWLRKKIADTFIVK